MRIILTQRQLKLILESTEEDSIEKIQKELISKGYDLGEYGPNKDGVDGIMGPLTSKAFKEEYGYEYEGEKGFEDLNDSELKSYNFHKIPLGSNNYRSAEPPKNLLKKIINKYGIKNIVRFNGDGSDSDGLSIEDERKICEENNCNFHKLSSTKNQDKVNQLLDSGNTLIHCHHGADRTGGNVGGWLKTKGLDTQKIWDYTTQYNGWEKMIKNNPEKFVKGGYLTQAKKFGVVDLEHAQNLS